MNDDASISDSDADLTAVVAMTPSGVIGKEGDIPWRLSADLRRFKKLTMGGVLIMGRRTFDSIGRPLPGRRTIVVTRNTQWSADGVNVVCSPEAALRSLGDQPGFVVGGAEIYRLLLPHCQRLYLTRVWSSIEGDTTLNLDLSSFRADEVTRLPASKRDDVPSEFWRMTRCC